MNSRPPAWKAAALPLELRSRGGWCRSRTCQTQRSRRVSTALPCRSANHPYSQINRAGGGRQQEAHSLLPYWSAWVDLNHRSPASKAGRDGQAPLHAAVSGSRHWQLKSLYCLLPTACSANGAHGRTRTCTSLIRNQELCPVELRVRCWLPDQDSKSGLTG